MAKKRPTLKQFKTMGDLLSGKTRGILDGELVQLFRIQKNWEKIVGLDLSKRTRPKEIRGKTLVISAENPAWSHHLSMMQKEILEVVSERSGRNFSQLKFVTEKINWPQINEEKVRNPLYEVHLDQDENLQNMMERLKKKSKTLQDEFQKKR